MYGRKKYRYIYLPPVGAIAGGIPGVIMFEGYLTRHLGTRALLLRSLHPGARSGWMASGARCPPYTPSADSLPPVDFVRVAREPVVSAVASRRNGCGERPHPRASRKMDRNMYVRGSCPYRTATARYPVHSLPCGASVKSPEIDPLEMRDCPKRTEKKGVGAYCDWRGASQELVLSFRSLTSQMFEIRASVMKADIWWRKSTISRLRRRSARRSHGGASNMTDPSEIQPSDFRDEPTSEFIVYHLAGNGRRNDTQQILKPRPPRVIQCN